MDSHIISGQDTSALLSIDNMKCSGKDTVKLCTVRMYKCFTNERNSIQFTINGSNTNNFVMWADRFDLVHFQLDNG